MSQLILQIKDLKGGITQVVEIHQYHGYQWGYGHRNISN